MSSREAELESRSTAISELISANEDLSRNRVVLEMKCVELEEQRDRWAVEEREVKQRMEVMRKELEVGFEINEMPHEYRSDQADRVELT